LCPARCVVRAWVKEEETPVLYLRFIRLEQGVNQETLAKRSRVRQQNISLIEIGRLNPTAEELARLADALHVSSPAILMKHVELDIPETVTTSEVAR
jgi:transcriptional regulator with XRE-family HTH domain